MGELLQNILSLRADISKLSEIGNEKSYEYCELAIKITDTEEEIEKIGLAKDNLEENIMDFKLKKGIFSTWPIGALISLSYFTFFIFVCLDKLTFGAILFTIIGAPAVSISLAFTLSAFLMHSKLFTNYLIKKHPSLKQMNDKLNNLIVRARITENNLNDIKKEKEKITNIILNNEDIIESKKDELNKLEEEYFHSIMNNPITNGTTYTLSSTGKKRTRTIGEKRNK